MKRIAVLTSGGDAPGMNACVRAVVRRGISLGLDVSGVHRGFAGLIDGDILPMDARSVGGIIQHGGTVLQTARSAQFLEAAGRVEALRQLSLHAIEGLVIIGGNGSMAGAQCLHEMGFPVVGAPASIDNDCYGADMSIGVDTALNTAIRAIDMIKDTASSHQRCFLVQVMGRKCGYLALVSGITGGAEVVILPEQTPPMEEVARILREAYSKGKPHAIAVIAEGAAYGAQELAEHLSKGEAGFEVRYTILGHVQRGGSPSAFDRLLATRLGVAAVEALAAGERGVMAGIVRGQIELTPLSEIGDRTRPVDLKEYGLAEVLAR